jgi:hypothetical protein
LPSVSNIFRLYRRGKNDRCFSLLLHGRWVYNCRSVFCPCCPHDKNSVRGEVEDGIEFSAGAGNAWNTENEQDLAQNTHTHTHTPCCCFLVVLPPQLITLASFSSPPLFLNSLEHFCSSVALTVSRPAHPIVLGKKRCRWLRAANFRRGRRWFPALRLKRKITKGSGAGGRRRDRTSTSVRSRCWSRSSRRSLFFARFRKEK